MITSVHYSEARQHKMWYTHCYVEGKYFLQRLLMMDKLRHSIENRKEYYASRTWVCGEDDAYMELTNQMKRELADLENNMSLKDWNDKYGDAL